MNKKVNKSKNFLDMVPIKNEKLKTEITDKGLVQIIIPRDGLMDRLVRLFLKTPDVMRIDFDAIGTCVWNAIDSKRNMQEIGDILKKEFGDEIEPIYERLGSHMNVLKNNKFIKIKH
jgi:hypothetical protein